MITSMWLRPGEDFSLPLALRQEVFQQELGWRAEEDRDGQDPYAFHLVLLLSNVPVATGRITYGGIQVAKLSRICVLPKYRRQGIGDGLVKILDYKASQMGMRVSQVETSEALKPFYQRIGYAPTGEASLKYGMKLISMQKETNNGSGENCSHQCTGPKG